MGVGDEVHEVAEGQRNLPKTEPDTVFVPTTCARAAAGKRNTHPCSLPGHADTDVLLGCEPLPPDTPKLLEESSACSFPLEKQEENKIPTSERLQGSCLLADCVSGKNSSTTGSCSHLSILELVQGGWRRGTLCEAEGWAPCIQPPPPPPPLQADQVWGCHLSWMFPAEVLPTPQGWQRCTGSCGAAAVGLSYPCRPGEEANPAPGCRREAAAEHLPFWVPCQPVSMAKGEAGKALSAQSAMAAASLCPCFLLFHRSYTQIHG